MADSSAHDDEHNPACGFPQSISAAEQIERLSNSSLEHALDARSRGLKVYESLKSLNDVIGTQYGERVLFELLQNAHDAHSPEEKGEITIQLIVEGEDNGQLLVANKGRPFSASNFEAIRNIGTSDKEIGEGIGNKGLGFRSVEALTEDVHIFSAGDVLPAAEFAGYCFRFATSSEIASRLESLGADSPTATSVAASIPRYLVPIAVKEQSEDVRRLAREGYATVICLPLTSARAVDLTRTQIAAVIEAAVPVQLFLDRLVLLDVVVTSDGVTTRKCLSRHVEPVASPGMPPNFRMERVTVEAGSEFLIIRQTLPKDEVLSAVRDSIAAAPPLKRWLDWKGDAVVSLAVSVGQMEIRAPRLFNFLPMDDHAVSPMAGHIDAPFFADIDRRSIKSDLPLNRYLIEAAAKTAAMTALAIVDNGLPLPKSIVIDLAAWSGQHMQKIIAAFETVNRSLAVAAIWPVVSGGPTQWASFDTLYAWPEARTKQLTPRRLAALGSADVLLSDTSEARLARVRNLATAVSLSLTPRPEVLCSWVEAIAEHFMSKGWRSGNRWREFYDDIVALFLATSGSLESLVGKQFLLGSDDKLLVATARGLDDAPPVFHRVGEKRGKRREAQPNPPSAISRKFRFLSGRVEVSNATLGVFEKAGLLRHYDALEALSSLKGALGDAATDNQWREALIWAFRVWRGSGGIATEDALRGAQLSVPCIGGWRPVIEASFSGTWNTLGKMLERYLFEAASFSPDCQAERDRLLVEFAEWPRSNATDRREDWLRFLEILGIRNGLRPVAGSLARKGTPTHYWNRLFQMGDEQVGLNSHWVKRARNVSLSYPQTEYILIGDVWRVPGQLEHPMLPASAREALSDLLVAYLRDNGDANFVFSVAHRRGFEKVELPTPLQVFLCERDWLASALKDDVIFAIPGASWSTTVARQIPPRFVPRFGIDPSSRSSLPPILFDSRVGLRDWAEGASAPYRLASLSAALVNLPAAERRDLRDHLRRAWSDIAEAGRALPESVELVVERTGRLELCCPDLERPQTVYIAGQRDGFLARALADAGEAVVDVGDADGKVICELLAATGAYTPRLADSGDVQLLVDGSTFEPASDDPRLVAGDLLWLSDVAVLAHEYLGDSFELRTLSPSELDQRLRQIRVRRCTRFAMTIAGQVITVRGNERVQAVLHSRIPTLLIAGDDFVDIGLLQEASSALTKLVGSRHNTLEIMLGRLARAGFSGGALRPPDEMLAHAIRREVGVIRDHFAAASGGAERHVAALLPVVTFLKDREAADRLSERLDRLGSSLQLREWLLSEFDAGLVDGILVAVNETDDQRTLCKRLGFDFNAYGSTLAQLGYPPLNDEADFRRIFAVFLTQIAPTLLDRLRRNFLSVWREGGDLSAYVELRSLDFIAFEPAWLLEREDIDLALVTRHANGEMDEKLSPDDRSVLLRSLDVVTASNRKLLTSRYGRLTSLVRAWCRKHDVARPHLTESADPQGLFRAIDQAGLIDFETTKSDELPTVLRRIGAWPVGMPPSDSLDELGLVEADLQHEEREAREDRRKADVAKRTVNFGGTSLDTGCEDFASLFGQLADKVLEGESEEWLKRSRPSRLALQDQQHDERRRTSNRGSKSGREWHNQPPEPVRQAMGLASEWLAREYLRRRYPKEMTDACWVSTNRGAFCTGASGDDSLGYDFRVETVRHEYLFEVKSAMDAGGEFEFTARELEVAGSANRDRKRRYRILYVPYVFDPARWRVLLLPNPVGTETRNKFRVVRSGSVRYRFELR
jgi:hypothetical protein